MPESAEVVAKAGSVVMVVMVLEQRQKEWRELTALSLSLKCVSVIMMEMAEGKGKGRNAGNSWPNGMMGYETVQRTLNKMRPWALLASDRIGCMNCNFVFCSAEGAYTLTSIVSDQHLFIALST